jgi:enoyl-CoA hydratase/3-hydroxyacyl-CoA dehydrogenase
MKVEDIKKIAMIGAGDMGHGIAEVLAMSGYQVNLYDIKQEFVDKGMSKIKESLIKQVSKQKMTQEAMDKAVGGIKGFTVLKDAVKDIDYAIEAAPEILDLKQKIFK